MASFWTCVRTDFRAALDNDPAARGFWAPIEVVLSYAGFHAIFFHRITHAVYQLGIPLLPRLMSIANRFLTGIEIHQAARIGPGFFIDHGMGVVIGETTQIGDDVLLYQGVVLGGTSLKKEKRHPTIGNCVCIGAESIVLGPITIGDNARVGAGSVVIKDVAPDTTVVGVPARAVTAAHGHTDDLEHGRLPDPVAEALEAFRTRQSELEDRLKRLEDSLGHAKGGEGN
jgi:serine O-acetyltransferase